LNGLSFKASTESVSCGVVASNDISFEGTLRRITSASFVDDAPRPTSTYSYLDPGEWALIKNLKPHLQAVKSKCTTMNGILQQLENLGHAPAGNVNGLTVELFDFQRQAIGWALERERQGGFERFLWTKLLFKSSVTVLDTVSDTLKQKPLQLYYSPILDIFIKEAPADSRGDLIAAQMGMGKTIISLLLVLMNPAPLFPASGTVVAGYDTPYWPRTTPFSEESSKKRGSIFSRGTLVVCNVSLVGQWVDEAKSKLKDPGLVYSYYGSTRKRDPTILAKNAIVVTTYAVLASDMKYHGKKSNDPNYCAPCEQIRWWRIICDESHTIRNASTVNFKALNRLTAANKWCVTGTLMNTTPNDSKSQLAFIGVNRLDRMFYLFANSMKAFFNNTSTRKRKKIY